MTVNVVGRFGCIIFQGVSDNLGQFGSCGRLLNVVKSMWKVDRLVWDVFALFGLDFIVR